MKKNKKPSETVTTENKTEVKTTTKGKKEKLKKNAKKNPKKNEQKENKDVKKFSFQKMMIWFLAIILIVSMVLPVLAGFI